MKENQNSSELLQRLLNGAADEESLGRLAELAQDDETLARKIAEELRFSELLRTALGGGVISSFSSDLESGTLSTDDLMSRVCDGSATPFECDQVVKHLWEFPEAVLQLRRDLAVDEWISEAVSESKSAHAFIESLETRMWAETRKDHFVDDFTKRLEREMSAESVEVEEGKILPFPGSWSGTLLKMASLAAVLAVGAFFLARLTVGLLDSRPAMASVVKSSSDVAWSSGSAPSEDGSIRSGLYELESGVVSMMLSSGSEITVQGPAIFEVGDDASTFVHAGIAMARTAANDLGISLKSKGLSVSEPARLIGIDARDADATEAIVFHGDGGICLSGGGKCRELSEFEAVKVDLVREKLVDVPYNPRAFSKTWAVLSGVEDNLGSVIIEMPGSEISASKSENGAVQVFVENESFHPENQLEVDQIVVGEFAVAEANPGQQLQAKGELRSYLLQLWPSDSPNGDGKETSLTFDHPVVGVIFSSGRLDSSDSSVGSESIPVTDSELSRRGMDSGNDQILLSQDRRTLNVRFKGGSDKVEQVRVLVALN